MERRRAWKQSPPWIHSTPRALTLYRRHPNDDVPCRRDRLSNPNLPIEKGDSDIVSVGKTVYYCDVHLSCRNFRAITKVRVHLNIQTCLRGTALAWYAAKSLLERAGLSRGVDEWVRELTARFMTSPSQAMEAVLREKYTVEDVRNGREPMAYVQAVVRHAEPAELPPYNYVLLAWRTLDSTLQLHVPRLELRPPDRNLSTSFWKRKRSGSVTFRGPRRHEAFVNSNSQQIEAMAMASIESQQKQPPV